MRLNPLFSALFLFPICAASAGTMLLEHDTVNKNTIVKTYSNESAGLNLFNANQRTQDYPTQVIRMIGELEGQQLNCDQVNKTIEKTLVNRITSDKFTFSCLISCTYDPDTQYAIEYEINGYFDPLNDNAVDYLTSFLNENNGNDLMGSKIQIESAQGLIVALNIAAGTRKNPDNPPFVEYRHDRNDFYFKSNYEMREKLFTDIYQNFFTNDPEKTLPFMDKWLFPHAGSVYKAVLRDANFVELQPEKIFLMGHEGDIFVPKLKYNFRHNCAQYENHRCLKDG